MRPTHAYYLEPHRSPFFDAQCEKLYQNIETRLLQDIILQHAGYRLYYLLQSSQQS